MTVLLALLLAQDAGPGGDADHGAHITCLDVSADGRRLLTGGWDQRIRVWDAATLKPLESLEIGTDLYAARFSPDGATVAVLPVRDTVELWREGKVARRLAEVPAGPAALAFTADGRRLAVATANGDLTVWDVADGRVARRRAREPGDLSGWALAPAGNRAAWSGLDALRIVDLGTGETRRVTGPFHAVAFSPDGSHVVAQHLAVGPLQVFDHRGAVRLRLAGPKGHLCALAISPDHRLLAASHNDPPEVRVWMIDGPARVVTVRGGTEAASQLAFSPDGARLYSAWGDGRLRATPVTLPR